MKRSNINVITSIAAKLKYLELASVNDLLSPTELETSS